ncbi:MAG: NAD(P)/FAD-dependent oxidoreductase [Flavobacteriaceae bacterium]|nr:NAD(P)/FAD-dependent oxidoreductase [Flavobacteriaceae bacterium]
MKYYDVIIIGGGAAGFFGAINMAEFNSELKIAILERGKEVLNKVKVSGGGRCNVTHAEFIPQDLVKNYPRGEKELLGPFHKFMTGDTITWFENRGIELKIEEDGRMFPVSNSSQTIIDCFLDEVERHQIDLLRTQPVQSIVKENSGWIAHTRSETFASDKILIATGSNPKIWSMLRELGHTIIQPVPSLFTFDIHDERIKELPGVVVKHVDIQVVGSQLQSEGPLLFTHVGMSAPAILKLSAFGALEFAECNYKFKIKINFIGLNNDQCLDHLKSLRVAQIKKAVVNSIQFELPKRLWKALVMTSGISSDLRWADLNNKQFDRLTEQLTQSVFNVNGKSTFKEEFVTAGGIDLKEVNFKTFESKLHEGLFFAGEVLNIDAVTGGFNFQNAWTGAYLAAKHISSSLTNG